MKKTTDDSATNESAANDAAANKQAGVGPIQRMEPMGELNMEDIELFTRLLIGISAEGSEMLLDRLRNYEAHIAQLLAEDPHEPDLDDASRVELIRYLAVGTMVRTQRGSIRVAHDTAALAINTSRSAFGLLDRATDNFVGRPLRRPAEALASRLHTEIGDNVVLGHKELSEGRVLARETTVDFIDDFIAYLSGSPELADLVSDQMTAQSLGVAGAVAEGGRSVTLEADNAVEGLIRRIFRRPARADLPKSPFAGKPEAVYHPGVMSSLPEHEADSTQSASVQTGKE